MKNEATSRLMKINWQNMQTKVNSKHADLLQDYFRRAALFLSENSPDMDLAFFDAADVLGFDDLLLGEDADMFLSELSVVGVGSLVRGICKSHLKIASLASEGNTRAVFHSGLYDPLISILEDGVNLVGVRKGELILGAEGYAIPLAGWRGRALPSA